MTYEAAYAELQIIIEEVATDVLSLDAIALKLRRATELLDFCRTRLRNVETELSDLIRD